METIILHGDFNLMNWLQSDDFEYSSISTNLSNQFGRKCFFETCNKLGLHLLNWLLNDNIWFSMPSMGTIFIFFNCTKSSNIIKMRLNATVLNFCTYWPMCVHNLIVYALGWELGYHEAFMVIMVYHDRR